MTVVGSDSEQTRIWQDQDRVEYHLRQFQKPYRSTVHFADFIRRLGPGAGEALDVACGAGANICHLSATVPGFRWTGIDIAGDLLFPLGKPLLRAQGIEATLVDGDFYRLTETFTGKKFDLVLFMQTLYAIEEPDAAVEQLMAVTRGWLVISSLFSDLDVDVRMRAIDHQRPANCQGPFIYNLFSLARFRVLRDPRREGFRGRRFRHRHRSPATDQVRADNVYRAPGGRTPAAIHGTHFSAVEVRGPADGSGLNPRASTATDSSP
jgi:Methyltransferase domain